MRTNAPRIYWDGFASAPFPMCLSIALDTQKHYSEKRTDTKNRRNTIKKRLSDRL